MTSTSNILTRVCRHCWHSIAVLLLLVSCSDIGYEYSSYPCYVVVDNSLFLDSSLASAMNNMSPGVFCLIQKTMSNGAEQFAFTTNAGLSSTQTFTAKEQQMNLVFGMNNGVIVGFGTLDYPATFFAYDRECPNCFDPNAVPVRSKPLTMATDGHATCAVCGRVYDMNNRGYIIAGDGGDPLTRYPASTSGPYGLLIIN